ncbi:hypothetical protein Lepto7376_1455 [[Leptolyngbya] sp. PCC 7376]|uniref:OmpA family protein n=1 Tax=[Leptolyngbya] sp. PCC 7376 TaxID=111781 RepID=UPI00029F279D|nr:OmpA family protein [[Leptolyngbya] sp. PCC 7376]AFY37799.1 hypothetical protein Lepto7376_1455 [[Leptolyngbya] sp. PCC 7376]
MSSSSSQPQAPSTVRRSSVTKWIIVFILRIVVLSGFAAGAIALGLVAGHLSPMRDPQKPLFLRLADGSGGFVDTAQPELNQTVASLSDEERVEIETEIEGIQAQLQVLATRTQKLEAELELGNQEGNLATRLSNLTELMETSPEEFDASDTAANSTPSNDLKITLPSNILFNDSGQLSAEAEEILGAIAIDLQQTRLNTIKISGHSFPENEAQAEALSFQQAQSVKVFLDAQIDGNYRWLVVGYGDSEPLAADDKNANQRIEITTQAD